MCRSSETPLDRIMSGLSELPRWLAAQPSGKFGDVVIKSREIIDRTEAIAADATRRFEKAGGYKADGFVGVIPWLRVNGKLSGSAAAERVEVAHQLQQLPRTEEALARGEIGYQHAVTMARTAQTLGAARDHHCVFPGCDRPAPWCDGHHLVHWADGGPTKLDNLGLVCGTHHRSRRG